jgi:hypothetical protein
MLMLLGPWPSTERQLNALLAGQLPLIAARPINIRPVQKHKPIWKHAEQFPCKLL